MPPNYRGFRRRVARAARRRRQRTRGSRPRMKANDVIITGRKRCLAPSVARLEQRHAMLALLPLQTRRSECRSWRRARSARVMPICARRDRASARPSTIAANDPRMPTDDRQQHRHRNGPAFVEPDQKEIRKQSPQSPGLSRSCPRHASPGTPCRSIRRAKPRAARLLIAAFANNSSGAVARHGLFSAPIRQYTVDQGGKACVSPSSAEAPAASTSAISGRSATRTRRSICSNRIPPAPPGALAWCSPSRRSNSCAPTIPTRSMRSRRGWRAGRTSRSICAAKASRSTASAFPRSAGSSCSGSCRRAPLRSASRRDTTRRSPPSTSWPATT